MSEQGDGSGAGAIPAGWYQDPADASGQRWWDGARWTTQVRTPPPPAPVPSAPSGGYVPLAPLAPAGAPAGPGEVATSPAGTTSGAYVPFQGTHVPGVRRRMSDTRTMWWLAAYPIWGAAPQFALVATAASLLGGVAGIALWLTIGALVLNIVLAVVLLAIAAADRRALLSGGNDTAAPFWWVLLTPLVYLIMRGRDVRLYDDGAWLPLIWLMVAIVLSPGAAVLMYFGVLGIIPT